MTATLRITAATPFAVGTPILVAYRARLSEDKTAKEVRHEAPK